MDSAVVQELIQAVETADVERVRSILALDPTLATVTVRHRDYSGDPLLHCVIPQDGDAVTDAHLAVADLLLQHGADINATGHPPNNEGGTALIHAAWGGHPSLVCSLLARGADTEARNHHGERAIDNAARHGNAAVVEALIEGGAPHDIAHTIQAGLVERTAQLLRQEPALLHRPNAQGDLALHLALSVEGCFTPALVQLLLDAGADLEARDARGRTALHCALDTEKPEAVQAILQYHVTIDVFAAAGLGDNDLLASMLATDPALASATQRDGLTPLHYAARHAHREGCELLFQHGAAADVYVERWWMEPTPLHTAALHGHTAVCELLLAHGASLERRNEHGYTPLLLAARWGHLPLVELLLEYGADLRAQDNNGVSALDWAAWFGNPKLARMLVERGFDVNLKGPAGSWSERTSLHFAAEHGHNELVQLLLEAGADPRASNRTGQTPHAVAVLFRHPGTAALLPA